MSNQNVKCCVQRRRKIIKDKWSIKSKFCCFKEKCFASFWSSRVWNFFLRKKNCQEEISCIIPFNIHQHQLMHINQQDTLLIVSTLEEEYTNCMFFKNYFKTFKTEYRLWKKKKQRLQSSIILRHIRSSYVWFPPRHVHKALGSILSNSLRSQPHLIIIYTILQHSLVTVNLAIAVTHQWLHLLNLGNEALTVHHVNLTL